MGGLRGVLEGMMTQDTAKIARQVQSEAVIQGLVGSLHDPVETVRLNAIESLIELEAITAVPALMAALQTDESDVVKKELVNALGRLKDPQAVPVLIAHIEARLAANGRVPLNAVWALGFLQDGRALDLLSRLRESNDPYVVWNANQALRQLRL